METHRLTARERSVLGKKVRAIRREGRLPAVLYGKGIQSLPIELDLREATAVLHDVSGSTLVDLNVGKQTHTVLVRSVQRDPIRGIPEHVDFLKVALDEIIRTTVPLELVGEPPAVKDLGGFLVTDVTEIEVEALPIHLPDRVTVDISGLATIDSSVTVGSLSLGENVKVLTEPEAVIARVIYEAEEEVVEEEVVEPVAAEPELVERRKKEEVEGEEEGEAEESK